MHLDIGPHTIHHGDSRDVLAAMPDNSVEAVVTDPPYALVSIVKRFGQPGAAPAKGNDAYARASAGFMGQSWDTGEVAFATEFWAQVLRVLKPGGHVVAFSGTRTYHRLAVAIEDSGFEIRDQLAWVYGSGFPKSHDVSKAIDKAFGAEREVVGVAGKSSTKVIGAVGHVGGEYYSTAPATPQAQQWEGWGTALKPAWEPIVLARKPLIGTVAANVLEHGTGAINIDGCRIDSGEEDLGRNNNARSDGTSYVVQKEAMRIDNSTGKGRFPANFIHDGSPEAIAPLPTGSERYFYSPKASKKDRGEGNTHPTVKPTDLMAYLCRLVTPPGGVILDPFMGSGSTGKGAHAGGFRFVGIEREENFFEISAARMMDLT